MRFFAPCSYRFSLSSLLVVAGGLMIGVNGLAPLMTPRVAAQDADQDFADDDADLDAAPEPPVAAQTGQPAAAFVARLREVGYFDTAIDYLNRVQRTPEKFPGVPPDFVASVPLERAQTHVDAAIAARNVTARHASLAAAEQELAQFIAAGDGPRRTEAQLLAGQLKMVSVGLDAGASQDETELADQRAKYLEAAEMFDAVIEPLRQRLTEMRGQRIERGQMAIRDQTRFEFLQAVLRSGEARQLAAQTYANPAQDGQPLLQEALKRFGELSDEYPIYYQGSLANLHRGQVQELLGNQQAALDSYQRVLDQRGIDVLLPARLQAMSASLAIRIAQQSVPQALIDQAQELVDQARFESQHSGALALLQLSLAKAHLHGAGPPGEPSSADANRRVGRSRARPLLLAAAKVSGPHESEARQLLADLAQDSKNDATADGGDKLPPAESLSAAFVKAREILQQTDDSLNQRDALLAKIAAAPDEATELRGELTTLDQQLGAAWSQLIDLLQEALKLPGGEPEAQRQVRQILTYGLFQAGDYWSAAVQGSYLARTAPHHPEGLQGGGIALSALQLLLQQATAVDQPAENSDDTVAGNAAGKQPVAPPGRGLIREIESLGTYMLSIWPNEPESGKATGILLQIALDQNRWDDAKRHLEAIPSGPQRAALQRLVGQILWSRSLTIRKDGDTALADRLVADALATLQSGLEGVTSSSLATTDLSAAVVLARLHLSAGNPSAAMAALDHPVYGPTQASAGVGDPGDAFVNDLAVVELQTIVSLMTNGEGDADQLLARAQAAMQRLQQRAAGQPNANERVIRVYMGLARDLKDQIDNAYPEQRSRLIIAFRALLDSIAAASTDRQVLQWVAVTLTQLGETTLNSDLPRAKQQGTELLQSARQSFERLRDTSSEEVSPALKYQLGRTYRLLGEYKKAADEFEAILIASPSMLDAQMEAARTYQQWAAAVEPKFAANAYRSALMGARPGADKRNVIWGWGRISQTLSGKQEFREQFFEACYQLAASRWMMGKVSADKAAMEQAQRDVQQVASLYPDMGGPKRRADFDRLIREIQVGLGNPPVGLP